jgi:hypothetical protein
MTTSDNLNFNSTYAVSSGSIDEFVALYLDPFTSGRARIATYDGVTGFYSAIKWFQTTNYGASWASISSPTIEAAGRTGVMIHEPYANPGTYYASVLINVSSSSGSPKLYRVVGSTVTDISINYSSSLYAPPLERSFRTHDTDANKMVLIGYNFLANATGIWYSTAGDTNFQLYSAPSATNVNDFISCWIGGNGNDVYLAGYNGSFWHSPDFFASPLRNKTNGVIGNVWIYNICGG